jgi:flavin reductase (DIM6/NTAB) family NADH-FMN oxidoreductase RutF
MKYCSIPLESAYQLLGSGPMVLVATSTADDGTATARYDLAPLAWNCPLDYEPVTKVLFVTDPAHRTADNARKSGFFTLCIPHVAQQQLVLDCGSCSGHDTDKFTAFGITCAQRPGDGPCCDIQIPDGCTGWIDCRLVRTVREGSVEIFMGEAIAACAAEGVWNGICIDYRNEHARMLHHLGGQSFGTIVPLADAAD